MLELTINKHQKILVQNTTRIQYKAVTLRFFNQTFKNTKKIKFITFKNIQLPNTILMLAQDVIWTSFQRFLNVMDVSWTSKQLFLDVDSTLSERYGSQLDIKPMLCAYLETVYLPTKK